jgi:hypothetical protein
MTGNTKKMSLRQLLDFYKKWDPRKCVFPEAHAECGEYCFLLWAFSEDDDQDPTIDRSNSVTSSQ